ncbi:MAG TPA: DUF1329 domain-containing protein [Candidatus Binatia bacterium]|jgi:hypothetical protein|nr:DUF1329 domain-containing protein [Candidatus Binatia bacterium]
MTAYSRKLPLVLVLVLGLVSVGGRAEVDHISEQLLSVFYPYRQGPPQIEGITPGLRLDHSNFQVGRAVLPAELLKYGLAGDFAITVQPTTDMPLREQYIKATEHYAPQVELGEGKLNNYVAGLPFPLIDPHDPRAGEKVAWNLRYQDEGETMQYWSTNEHRTGSGVVERTERFYSIVQYGMHRPAPADNPPQWEKLGVYTKRYNLMLSPADLEGSQALTYRYDQDTRLSDKWVYDPKSRRTRKVVDNPYEAPGNGELLAEDIWGFYGYLHAYEWTYLGEQVVLAPGPIQAAAPTWGGHGNWYPVDPWELRRARVVEARSKESHPLYSRRVLYIDLQTDCLLYSLAYDHTGAHKRTFINVYYHPTFNPWHNESGIPQYAAQASMDHQWDRAGIFQVYKVFYNRPLTDLRVGVAGLMLYGK